MKEKLILKYQYSNLPEMIPLNIKQKLRKVLKSEGKEKDKGMVFRTGKWVAKMSEKYDSYVIRPERKIIKTGRENISDTSARMSYKKEKFIQFISQKKYYCFDEMMVILDPYNWAPLTALLIFYTRQKMAVRYTVKGKTKETNFVRMTKPEKEHRVPVMGLYPNTKNKLLIELIDECGTCVNKRTIEIPTKPLPDDLKDVVIPEKYTKKSAYDLILISGGINIRTCAFDMQGNIRYYLSRKTKAYGIFPVSGGKFFYMERQIDVPSYSVSQSAMMHEMDYFGRIYRTYLYENGYHHCMWEMEPGGNILVGSSSLDGYEENVVAEIDRITGRMADFLNLNQIFDETYRDWPGWVHLNAVSYCKEDNSIIISMRNIHSIAKVDWKTKKLKWIFANPKMWEETSMKDKVLKPVGDVKWCYQQHAAYELSENLDGKENTKQMIVYDNHWARRRPVEFYDGDEKYSYLNIYTIDETQMTVSMQHSTTVANSRIRSNARLEYDKKRIFNMAGDLFPEIDGNKGMMEEYDYETNELLNRFYIKPGFFTAYHFEPDVDAMEKPLTEDYNYLLGNTISFQEYHGDLSTEEAKKFNMQEIQVSIRFEEDILLVKAMDHSISYIYLIGEKNLFYVDMTGTYQTQDIFKDKIYEVPYWIKNIPEDTYQIYCEYRNELYDLEESFSIKNSNR